MLPFPHQLLSKKVVQKTSDNYLYLFISDIVNLYFRIKSVKIISESKWSTNKGLLISDNSRATDIFRRAGSVIKMLSKIITVLKS